MGDIEARAPFILPLQKPAQAVLIETTEKSEGWSALFTFLLYACLFLGVCGFVALILSGFNTHKLAGAPAQIQAQMVLYGETLVQALMANLTNASLAQANTLVGVIEGLQEEINELNLRVLELENPTPSPPSPGPPSKRRDISQLYSERLDTITANRRK